MHAADDLLAERGFNAVTIEGIAARAGVAKQTIYRWWPSKVDILLDTLLDDAAQHLVIAETGSVVEGVRGYLGDLARFMSVEPAGKVLLALLGEAQQDAVMAQAFQEQYLVPRREAERALLQRGVSSGEFSADLDVDAALDALIGPIVYRALVGAEIPATFVDALVAKNLG